MMRKYLAILRISFQNIFEYRWNFLLGRLRNIILLLTLYYLWSTVFVNQNILFGFNFVTIMTYVYVVQILRSVVLDTRGDSIGEEISGNGKFFSYLLRPVGYFKYWLSVDLSYKVVNIIFTILELFVVAKILNIPLFLQADFLNWWVFMMSVILATLMYFMFISWVSFLSFWTTQIWGARFALSLLLEFTSGAFFPLDVLPRFFQQFLNLTPFPYLAYFPTKVYLGHLSLLEMIYGLSIQIIWMMVMFYLARLTWLRGLKVYQAFGG